MKLKSKLSCLIIILYKTSSSIMNRFLRCNFLKYINLSTGLCDGILIFKNLLLIGDIILLYLLVIIIILLVKADFSKITFNLFWIVSFKYS